MRPTTLILLAAITSAGCTAQTPQAGMATDRAGVEAGPSTGTAQTDGQGAPRGGSSPVPVLIGIVIGVGLITLLLSTEDADPGAMFVPPG